MKFSVIVPCYNAGPWIGTALRSAAAQKLPPHEILVVDDGSTDDSRQQIVASGVEVRLLTGRGGNAAAARNVAIRAATGDWIAMLDADDEWYPHHLEQSAALLAGTDDVALMANHHWMDVCGVKRPIPDGFFCSIREATSGLRPADFIRTLAKRLHFGHSTVMYRRDRVMAVGGFDESQVKRHDIDLWLRVLAGKSWAYHNREAAAYRADTPGSISSNEIDAEYYYLRALLKNAPAYRVPEMDELIRISARRAMGLAFVDGRPIDLRNAWSIGSPFLKPSFRWFYRCTRVCPPAFRWAMRIRRKILWAGVAAASQ